MIYKADLAVILGRLRNQRFRLLMTQLLRPPRPIVKASKDLFFIIQRCVTIDAALNSFLTQRMSR